MAGRLRRLFRRYATYHLRLARPGPALTDPAGTAQGRIERIALQNGLMIIEGYARAGRVVAELGGQKRSAVPVPRPGGQPGFRLALPFAPGPLHLSLEGTGGALPPLILPGISAARLWAGRLALLPGFALRTARALPAARQWFQSRDPAARDRVKRLLGLVSDEELLLAPDLFRPPGAAHLAPLTGPVTILLPVYNAFDLLQDCLDRLVRHSDLPWRLIVIEDASPDPRIRPFLRDFAASRPAGQVVLLENPANLGFIGAVNRGLTLALDRAGPEMAGFDGPADADLDPEGHRPAARQTPADSVTPLVLLNSDALVPQDWLSRLLAPMRADPVSCASVTPMSNDAELATVPVICKPGQISPDEALAIDAIAARIAPLAALAEAPTGVGFCMALNARFLVKSPLLDSVFGRGYGEEVDWCQKVGALGGRHLYQPGLFVEHRGGSSFGSAEKRQLLQRNGQIISQRHPRFDDEVQAFLAEDPLLTPRLALGLGLAAARAEARRQAAVPLYLAHSLGGGADHWLMRQIAKDVAETGAALVLRVGGARRWRLELYSEIGADPAAAAARGPQSAAAATVALPAERLVCTFGASDDTGLIRQLLALLPRRRVIYSCGVGDADPVSLPQLLLDLASGPQDQLEILLHDYFPISPSYTLLDRSGAYHGVPQPGPGLDAAHSTLRPDGSRVGLAEWRRAWDPLVARADKVVVFSKASQEIAETAWPGLGSALQLSPHVMPPLGWLASVQPASAAQGGLAPERRPVIGILGHMAQHKGAALVSDLSRLLAKQPVADLVIIGALDPAFRLSRPARQHGPYRLEQLPELIRRYGITCWLVPSVCPETFSFTTREALATGLPVWSLDLGGQADAVRAALDRGAKGGIIPRQGELPLASRVLAALLAKPAAPD